LSGQWLKPVSGVFGWNFPEHALQLPDNGCVTIRGELPSGTLTVRYRQGGEQMCIARRGHRDLKRLLNEAQVPGFARDRLPLLYCADELLAVANLPALSNASASGFEFNWVPPIGAQGLS
jgi:tRNA(Ile)-lysidine synthase